MKTNQKKPVYFNVDGFVNMVLTSTGLDKSDQKTLEQLHVEISQTLSDRITATVIVSLGDKEMDLLERILQDHTELDKIDALSIITPSIPGLNERILKAVNDLFEELVGTFKMMNDSLNKQQSK